MSAHSLHDFQDTSFPVLPHPLAFIPMQTEEGTNLVGQSEATTHLLVGSEMGSDPL